ncbi:Acetyltransferase, GNAT family [Rhodopirellula islandica]|uniref:Acetyltransferase, GNAT family n=1 Tax=Rhodopirellula islandica TaxID=595434 RepID=A0A0J1B309_RHOIS|nr:GNAT family N-acetyltransferase [Rhodopirellula islandica]KLU01162.1 Acetyltransferase, GNAT family [Rhodopirellula islandica]
MNGLLIRDLTIEDSAAVVELNEAVVALTSPMDAERFATLHALSSLKLAAEIDGRLAGFLLAIPAGAAYDNGNFQWFSERHDHFVYIDRVVVSNEFRGLGIGRVLYSRAFDEAKRLGALNICAEIDFEPANQPSLRFHESAHFVAIGTRLLDSGKTVSMQIRSLTD